VYDDFGNQDDFGDVAWGEQELNRGAALPPRIKKKKKKEK